jgi:hypothetical protein
MNTFKAVHVSSLVLTGFFLFAARALPAFSWAGGVLVLSLLHFAATLQLFYREEGVLKRRPILSLGLPLAFFGGTLAWAILGPASYPYLLVGFFPILFWHYAKQSMGIFVLSVRAAPGMNDPASVPRQLVLAVFLLLGVYGYLSSQVGASLAMSFGFYIPTLQLSPGPWVMGFRISALLGLAYLAYLAFRKGEPLSFATPLAFYLWMDFPLFGFALLPFLPALHALQYLPLAIQRGSRSVSTATFVAVLTVLSAFLFAALRLSPRTLVGFSLVVATAELVLNVHHYFLDAYIWRARDGRNAKAMGID